MRLDRIGEYLVATIAAILVALFLFSIVLVLIGQFSTPAKSHPIDGKKNAAGEWCCGEGDCFAIDEKDVRVTAHGYLLFGVETVPFSEALPAPDNQYWRCKRHDNSRRCFFAPPQSY